MPTSILPSARIRRWSPDPGGKITLHASPRTSHGRVAVGQEGQRKIWQQEYWGDRDWSRSNNRRTYVEGAFGNMKNPSTENLSRGTFRITGLARVTLFLGVLAAAHNRSRLGW